MKFVSLILAIHLLTSCLHVCFGDLGYYDVMETQMEQQDVKKHACCKGNSSEDNPSEENLPCNEGCACCFVMPIVCANNDKDAGLHSEFFHHQNSRISNHYNHSFNHLIWHPPQLIS